MFVIDNEITNFEDLPEQFPAEILLRDFFGFDQNFNNATLEAIDNFGNKCNRKTKVYHTIKYNDRVCNRYHNIDFAFYLDKRFTNVLQEFKNHIKHPELNFQNFICSFGGSDAAGKKLLASALHQFGWFNPETCSKNFCYTIDMLDGHLTDLLKDDVRLYRKFFINKQSEQFFSTKFSFGHLQYNHAQNIRNLEQKICRSFLHLVAETQPTSYHPFVTEKFLYSIVTRGLYLCYAQPGWHEYVERYFGFRRYNKIFDYRFDLIDNPVLRLLELLSMLTKFSFLDTDDWRDLYQMEVDTVEHNYDHYFSGAWLRHLETSTLDPPGGIA